MIRLFFLLLLLLSTKSFALQELIVRDEITAYAKRSSSSRVLRRLNAGDRVILSTRNYGSWRKIQLEFKGRKKFAWIMTKEIQKSRVRFIEADEGKKKKSLIRHRYAVGFTSFLSYLWADAREVDSEDGKVSKIDASSGVAMYFGFSLDIPYTDQLSFRLYLNLREDDVNGKQSFVEFSGAETSKSNFNMQRSYTSIGLLTKFYSDKYDRSWWGATAEFANGNSVNFEANSLNIEVGKDSLPVYVFLIGSWGYDYSLMKNGLLTPEIRLGTALNSDSLTLNPEFLINASYMF